MSLARKFVSISRFGLILACVCLVSWTKAYAGTYQKSCIKTLRSQVNLNNLENDLFLRNSDFERIKNEGITFEVPMDNTVTYSRIGTSDQRYEIYAVRSIIKENKYSVLFITVSSDDCSIQHVHLL